MSEPCTFTKTGKQYTRQPVYRCRTCKLVGNLGMCQSCARTCHLGHDTFYHHYGTFFCDCGERGEPFCKIASAARTSTDAAKTSRQAFECPVCLSPMRPPIFMCERGHNVCATCQEEVKQCPLCRGQLTGARNLAMETLSQSLQLDCEDCSEPVRIANFNDHKKVCSMSLYGCPLQPHCSWSSKLWDIFEHCRDTHTDRILHGPEHHFKHTNFAKSKDFETNIIVIEETVFLYHRQYKYDVSMLQAVVKHANSVQDSKFSYTLTFDSPTGVENIVIKKTVRPVYENVEEIYNLHNCAILYMSQVTSIVNMDCLEYTLKITPL